MELPRKENRQKVVMPLSKQIVFRQDHFIVVRSFSKKGMYYTIVNTKRGKHAHVYKEEITAAIMICKCAHRNVIPEDYPNWMKESIRRIKDDNGLSTVQPKTKG